MHCTIMSPRFRFFIYFLFFSLLNLSNEFVATRKVSLKNIILHSLNYLPFVQVKDQSDPKEHGPSEIYHAHNVRRLQERVLVNVDKKEK